MKEVWVIMTATLGVPPSPEHAFVFDFYDTAGKAGKWTGTPVEFYKAFLGKYPVRTVPNASHLYISLNSYPDCGIVFID